MNKIYSHLDTSQKFIDFLDKKCIYWRRIKWGGKDNICIICHNDEAYFSLMKEYFKLAYGTINNNNIR